MTEERKGMIAAAVAYSIFGLSYLFSKIALNVADTMILLCVRFSITFVVLNLLVLTRIMKLDLKGKNLLGPILVGIIQPVLYFVFENYGLKYTTTSFTGVTSAVSPIFTAIMGAVILREKPNLRQWICIGVSIVGVLMISLGTTSGSNTLLGCVCLLIAYFSGSFYSILVRKLSKDFSPFTLTYIMFTVGFVAFASWAFIQYGNQTVPMLADALSHKEFVISALYLGAAASVGAYMLANYSLSRLTVMRSTIFGSFSTIVSVLSGIVIMKDPFTPVSAISFVLIMVGVWGVNRFSSNK